jgi:hypothetical protein
MKLKKYTKWLGMVMHACKPSYLGGESRRMNKNARPYLNKYWKQKGWGMAQVVEALSLSPSITHTQIQSVTAWTQYMIGQNGEHWKRQTLMNSAGGSTRALMH